MNLRKLSDLHPLENNPRTIRDASFKQLCESVKNNPKYFEAMIKDETGYIKEKTELWVRQQKDGSAEEM